MRMTLHDEGMCEDERIIGTINIGILFVIRHGGDRRWCSRFGMRFLLLILVADLCLDLLVLNSCLYDRALRFHMIAPAPLRK